MKKERESEKDGERENRRVRKNKRVRERDMNRGEKGEVEIECVREKKK
jgi:hypothetical protein